MSKDKFIKVASPGLKTKIVDNNIKYQGCDQDLARIKESLKATSKPLTSNLEVNNEPAECPICGDSFFVKRCNGCGYQKK